MSQSAPLPSDSRSSSLPTADVPAGSACLVGTHEIERAVVHCLQSHPSLRFTRLQVHQCAHDSVCLEGFLESNEDEIDLCDLVRGIHGIRNVVNRVLMARPSQPIPKKG